MENTATMDRKVKISARQFISGVIVCLIAPATLIFFSGNTNFYLPSALILMYGIIALVISIEGRSVQPREFIIISVISMIAAVSRVVLQPLPFVSPLMGFVVIGAISFGPQAGFLMGVLSAIFSGFVIGIGPWIPAQMVAFGLGGFVAGITFKKIIKSRNKVKMAIMGYLIVQILVAFVLDSSGHMADLISGSFQMDGWLANVKSGAIVNFIHGVSVAVTIFIVAKPMLEKLDRIKSKYGLMEGIK